MYRKHKKMTYTIGRMYFADMVADTSEPPVRELLDINGDGDFDDEGEGKGMSKVYGNTAIPEGKYRIKMQHSPTFKRPMPYLQKVKGFTGIMIHPLSDVSQTMACIGIGENTIQGRLVNSRAWSDLLNSKITAAENNGEDVWIEIND
jgi:hypothetical protein